MSKQPIVMGSAKYRAYVPVGVGNVGRYGVSGRGALLDIAARSGLPTPAAIILLDMAWKDALSEVLITVEADTVHYANADRLINKLNLPNSRWEFPGPFTISAAFAPEQADFSFEQTDIDPANPQALADALCAVWASAFGRADHESEGFRRDMVIMHMIDARQRGIAHLNADDSEDRIESSGESRTLPQIAGGGLFRPPNRQSLDGRLQLLLRDVRKTFNQRKTRHNWIVWWADDGEKCWLLEIRPQPDSNPSS